MKQHFRDQKVTLLALQAFDYFYLSKPFILVLRLNTFSYYQTKINGATLSYWMFGSFWVMT